GLLLVAPTPVWASLAAGPAPVVAQDYLFQARELATSGKRAEAIKFLQDRLVTHPDDPDARTLLGIILSWEGRYPEARQELRQVLTDHSGYYDAMSGLAYVELWDDHPDLALNLSDSLLRKNPSDTSIMLLRARALSGLNRTREAIDQLDRLLRIDPKNTAGKQMRGRLADSQRSWGVGVGYGGDWFSDQRTPWQEQWLSLRRKTGIGSVSFTAAQADRWDQTDQQYEFEMYPRLRPGTYMYLDAGWSPNVIWYPEYRAGIHLYQSFGSGFEGSFGYSRLGFGTGVNIYIASLSKYVGRWLLTGQVFITPKDLGTNASYHGAVRYYYADSQYVGARYHYGAAKEEIQTIDDILILNSSGVSGEWVFQLGRRFDFTVRAAYDDQERYSRVNLKQYSSSAQLFLKF
ncbi:MAG: YaiO family outer membrane beta-barrel protein, partial [Acidobacteria bacterium]|nr:YaiO family outer membrane beta-barrel protein [Acidobacteriota bacterium]